MAHPKHDQVRQRYQYRCGYCGVSEEDAGGELTVDHYFPLSAGGDDSDENLVYACIRCNQNKGEFWPDTVELTKGQYIIHPTKEEVSLHIREDADCILEGLTETGRFHIRILKLNRPPLIEHRRAKKRQTVIDREYLFLQAITDLQQRLIQEMAETNRSLRQRVEQYEASINNIEALQEEE